LNSVITLGVTADGAPTLWLAADEEVALGLGVADAFADGDALALGEAAARAPCVRVCPAADRPVPLMNALVLALGDALGLAWAPVLELGLGVGVAEADGAAADDPSSSTWRNLS
jgi:hypothetical protein